MADNFLRRKVGIPIEQTLGPQSAFAQGSDQAAAAIQNKLQALQGISAAPMGASDNLPLDASAPPDAMGASPTNRPFTGEERDLKINAMMNAPMAMEQAAAKLRAQADIDAANEAHANELEGPMDMSGYKPYPRFQELQKKVQGQPEMKQAEKPKNIRDSLKGMVEVTPELERQLGYGPRDEEEDDNAGKNMKYSSKETGTRGGI